MNGKKKGMILAVLAMMTGLVLTLAGCGQSGVSLAGGAGIKDSTQAQVASTSENQVMATGTALSEGTRKEQAEKQEGNLMRITVGDRVLTAVLADNSSAEALKEILASGPLTIDMSDYGNMEKVGPIGQSLPTNDEQITTGPGDMILYMGNSLVIYYDTNSWNFTRLGKIQDVTQAELKEILGGGGVTVTLSLEEETASGEKVGSREEMANGFVLSSMGVQVSCQDRTANFRLYDTQAAKEFYDQLPLELELSNFRDAQWMFYPPQKLSVKAEEAYHDGKKGELSYYAPWGDVFMLYEDFYAGDEMHRLGVGISGVEEIAGMSGVVRIDKMELEDRNGDTMRIRVKGEGKEIVYELNDSPAAAALYAQLPLSMGVEDFGSNEKIFYPPQKLDTAGTPLADAGAGTLAYYAPWGDVVMFYQKFGSGSGLYELGKAVSGAEQIGTLSGTITIEKAE